MATGQKKQTANEVAAKPTKKKAVLSSAMDFLQNLKTENVNPQRYERVDIDLIDPDPNQPRDTFQAMDGRIDPFSEEALNELAQSMELEGQHQAIVIVPRTDSPGRFKIVMGERRWRASRINRDKGLSEFQTIEAKIKEISGPALRLAQLSENLQREDLTDLQVAHFIKMTLEEFPELKKQELGTLMKKKSPYISRILALVDPKWSNVVDAGIITYASLLEQYKALPENKQGELIELAKSENRSLTISDIRKAASEVKERTDSNVGKGGPLSDQMISSMAATFDTLAVPGETYAFKGERRTSPSETIRSAPTDKDPNHLSDTGSDEAHLPSQPFQMDESAFERLPVKLTVEQLAILAERCTLPQSTVIETQFDISAMKRMIRDLEGEVPENQAMLVANFMQAINRAGK
jgi:ParB family chromosome partitioning protein